MQKWVYKQMFFNTNLTRYREYFKGQVVGNWQTDAGYLDQLGLEGWEMCGLTALHEPGSEGLLLAVLKRPQA
jgi:hypothetical protein